VIPDDQLTDAAGFYGRLGDDYDLMTNFTARLENQRPLIVDLVEKFNIRSVLDIGCGSGVHAILLAQAGARVTAVDPSAELIELARQHAQEAKVEIDLRVASMQSLASTIDGAFDTVLCLGNTLPHLLTEEELESSLQGISQLLAPEGTLLLQLLNYDRILSQRKRVVGIRRAGEQLFVRFYDFTEPNLTFNILRITLEGSKSAHELISTELYPWRGSELLQLLESTGFGELQVHSDLLQSPFNPDNSTDLVIVARK
jgi:2-polyprenyl-3-methyl-5-hydroxy-6-metoxy-1,4-benzoquinol methylase